METNSFSEETKSKLESLGYKILERNSLIIGRVDAIHISENGIISTGADPRGDDKAVNLY